ncbi:MAG: membrane protein insertion efficiency factor YidD [Planctomycetota bacterium]
MTWLLIKLVRGYQIALSPLLGGHCRFTPTCSHYAIDALRKYGPIKGSAKAAWRIMRCNPFGGKGYDPA